MFLLHFNPNFLITQCPQNSREALSLLLGLLGGDQGWENVGLCGSLSLSALRGWLVSPSLICWVWAPFSLHCYSVDVTAFYTFFSGFICHPKLEINPRKRVQDHLKIKRLLYFFTGFANYDLKHIPRGGDGPG